VVRGRIQRQASGAVGPRVHSSARAVGAQAHRRIPSRPCWCEPSLILRDWPCSVKPLRSCGLCAICRRSGIQEDVSPHLESLVPDRHAPLLVRVTTPLSPTLDPPRPARVSSHVRWSRNLQAPLAGAHRAEARRAAERLHQALCHLCSQVQVCYRIKTVVLFSLFPC
jgi:hypothetical protein